MEEQIEVKVRGIAIILITIIFFNGWTDFTTNWGMIGLADLMPIRTVFGVWDNATIATFFINLALFVLCCLIPRIPKTVRWPILLLGVANIVLSAGLFYQAASFSLRTNYPLSLVWGNPAFVFFKLVFLYLQVVFCVFAVWLIRTPLHSGAELRVMRRRRKAVLASLSGVISIAVIVAAVFASSSHSAVAAGRVSETEDGVVVEIGYSGAPGDMLEYERNREGVMAELERSHGQTRTLLTFSEYWDIEDVEAFFGRYDKSMRLYELYVAVPGEPGYTALDLWSNDFGRSAPSLLVEGLLGDNDAMTHNGKVFAVTVKAHNIALEHLALRDDIFADPFYSEEAEALSERTGKAISYVCMPNRPDAVL